MRTRLSLPVRCEQTELTLGRATLASPLHAAAEVGNAELLAALLSKRVKAQRGAAASAEVRGSVCDGVHSAWRLDRAARAAPIEEASCLPSRLAHNLHQGQPAEPADTDDDVDVDERDDDCCTPLHVALLSGTSSCTGRRDGNWRVSADSSCLRDCCHLVVACRQPGVLPAAVGGGCTAVDPLRGIAAAPYCDMPRRASPQPQAVIGSREAAPCKPRDVGREVRLVLLSELQGVSLINRCRCAFLRWPLGGWQAQGRLAPDGPALGGSRGAA